MTPTPPNDPKKPVQDPAHDAEQPAVDLEMKTTIHLQAKHETIGVTVQPIPLHFTLTQPDKETWLKRWEVIIGALLVVLTVANFWFSWKVNRHQEQEQEEQERRIEEQAQADITSRFQSRYTQLTSVSKSQVSQGVITPGEYYQLFWDQQFDQYQMWRKNKILPGVFEAWMGYRYAEYKSPVPLENKATHYRMTYAQGFEAAVKVIPDPTFKRFFTDTVFKGYYFNIDTFLQNTKNP